MAATISSFVCDMVKLSSVLVSRARLAAIVAGLLWPVVLGLFLLVAAVTGALGEEPSPETLGPLTVGVAGVLFVPILFLMVSLWGIYARYEEPWGGLGKLGLTVGLIGLVVFPVAGAASALGVTGPDFEPTPMGRIGSLVAILATLSLSVGFVVLGWAALKSETPSRRFGVVMIGVGLFQTLILLVSVLRVLAYSLGWIVLGLALPRVQRASE